jgi:ABC-2 type transport system ATP-binding protein
MDLAIECHNLVKTYPGRPPVEAVRGIDVEMQVGECFGVLGPNGAGKTTTIEVLEGLLAPTSGEVKILGRDWRTDANEIRERIGISLQETRLSDKLTVLETLKLFRSFYRTSLSAEEAMARVSLEAKATTWVKRLSGGQRQRLAVATALVGEPELIFLDEPTTGLDPQSRRQLWEIIRDYRNRGRSVLLTTHYMDEAERLCDRVAIVDRGKVIALGSPAELIRQIGGEHVVEFSVNQHQAMTITVEELQALPSVSTVQLNADHVLLTVKSPHLTIPALLTRLQRDQLEFKSLTTRQASLEDVFVSLTGRSLVEEEEVVKA